MINFLYFRTANSYPPNGRLDRVTVNDARASCTYTHSVHPGESQSSKVNTLGLKRVSNARPLIRSLVARLTVIPIVSSCRSISNISIRTKTQAFSCRTVHMRTYRRYADVCVSVVSVSVSHLKRTNTPSPLLMEPRYHSLDTSGNLPLISAKPSEALTSP